MIDESLIKEKIEIKDKFVSITYSNHNGIAMIDTTQPHISGTTYSDVSIYKMSHGRTIIAYSYQKIKSAAQLKSYVDKCYSEKTIQEKLDVIGVNRSDYRIKSIRSTGFFGTCKLEVIFRNQKIIIGKKTKMYLDCKDYCIIS